MASRNRVSRRGRDVLKASFTSSEAEAAARDRGRGHAEAREENADGEEVARAKKQGLDPSAVFSGEQAAWPADFKQLEARAGGRSRSAPIPDAGCRISQRLRSRGRTAPEENVMCAATANRAR